ncbi:MAG TPA: DciA family protein [Gaiellaceae bacterium]|jgi:Dna[CI] antecedent, DciA|nr:DciA family protein [Gaiellaceae bacterium]
MERLGEQVRSELRRVGSDSGAGDVVTAWPAAVGEEIARNAWPARTQPDGTLVVHVRDSVWGFELTQRAGEIAGRLPGRPRLRFVPGPLPDAAPEPASPELLEATPEQAREAAALTSEIADPELREYVAKAIKMALARSPDDRSV